MAENPNESELSANEAVTFLQRIKPGQVLILSKRLSKDAEQIIRTQLGRMGIRGLHFEIRATRQGGGMFVSRPSEVPSTRRSRSRGRRR